eukprot:scaffold78827_cov19-Tisochrysis_lutea.AAC.1
MHGIVIRQHPTIVLSLSFVAACDDGLLSLAAHCPALQELVGPVLVHASCLVRKLGLPGSGSAIAVLWKRTLPVPHVSLLISHEALIEMLQQVVKTLACILEGLWHCIHGHCRACARSFSAAPFLRPLILGAAVAWSGVLEEFQ